MTVAVPFAGTEAWEAAYRRFETPRREVRKFVRRLRWAGAEGWPRTARIVELFCGRGGGLAALEQLGFHDLEGVDLSPSLVSEYRGGAHCRVADCRDLPQASASKDVLVVHGGLHHLERIPADLERVLDEARRVLVPQGLFIMVEPWMTPFLGVAHRACATPCLRRVWPRLDALATMIELEGTTYGQWLDRPHEVRRALEYRFDPCGVRIGRGKLMFRGRRRGRAGRP